MLEIFARELLGEGMDEIGVAIIIPEGAGVDPAGGLGDAVERFPRAGGVFGFGHEDAAVRVAEENVELAIVKADGRRPDAAAVDGVFHEVAVVVLDGVADEGPVDEVFGVEDGQAGETGEAAGGEVIVVADAADIRIGVVGEDNGIGV